MLLTAQDVEDRAGLREVHAFLHRHDRADCPFPYDAPLSVPEYYPGRLEAASQARLVQPGGNNVIAYFDFILPDERWTPAWAQRFLSRPDVLRAHALPWVVRFEGAHVVFNAMQNVVDPVAEYIGLANAAANLLREVGWLPSA